MFLLKDPVIKGIESPFADMRMESWKCTTLHLDVQRDPTTIHVEHTSQPITLAATFRDAEFQIPPMYRESFREHWNGFAVDIEIQYKNCIIPFYKTFYKEENLKLIIPSHEQKIGYHLGTWPILQTLDKIDPKKMVLETIDAAMGPSAQTRLDLLRTWFALQKAQKTLSIDENLNSIALEWFRWMRVFNGERFEKICSFSFVREFIQNITTAHQKLQAENHLQNLAEQLEFDLSLLDQSSETSKSQLIKYLDHL